MGGGFDFLSLFLGWYFFLWILYFIYCSSFVFYFVDICVGVLFVANCRILSIWVLRMGVKVLICWSCWVSSSEVCWIFNMILFLVRVLLLIFWFLFLPNVVSWVWSGNCWTSPPNYHLTLLIMELVVNLSLLWCFCT